jgi:hypothetical protein
MKFREYITEKASIYDNNKVDKEKLYDRGSVFYFEVNNKYDMNFKNKKELDKWLKKEKYEWVGMD